MTDTDPSSGAPDPRDADGDPLRAAAETMRAVRDRCVWTQRIDNRALVPYLVEESAELIDAVESGTRAELREELGDLLWQVLFHAEIASRDPEDPFDIDDVARGLTDKMVRRHPHVFAGEVAETPEQVLVLWNAAKAHEKRARTSVLDGVSERMPTLALAQKLVGKAALAGVDPPARFDPRSLSEPARRSLSEPAGRDGTPAFDPRSLSEPAGRDETPAPRSEAELGDALLALVAAARAHGWDAERALRERLRALSADIRSAESATGSGDAAGSGEIGDPSS